MALSPYDQQVYDAGFKFVPQTQYLLNPFQIPQGDSAPPSGPVQPTGIATLGGGGDNYSPYNPDPNRVRTDYRPNYDFRQFSEYGSDPSMMDRKQMDMNQEYFYGKPPSGIQQALLTASGFIPGVGPAIKGAQFLGGAIKDLLPVNQRAILENELRGGGVYTDDIGRIVVGPDGQYNTPEGIMAGYNASRMTDKTFDKRTGTISKSLQDKTSLTQDQINDIVNEIATTGTYSGDLTDEDLGVKNLFSNLINVNKAKFAFRRTKKKADDIAAFEENLKQQKKLEKQRAKTKEADTAAGAFKDTVQLDPGGGGTWKEQTAAKERQGEKVAGPGFGKGAYFMDGGLVDLVDIYD